MNSPITSTQSAQAVLPAVQAETVSQQNYSSSPLVMKSTSKSTEPAGSFLINQPLQVSEVKEIPNDKTSAQSDESAPIEVTGNKAKLPQNLNVDSIISEISQNLSTPLASVITAESQTKVEPDRQISEPNTGSTLNNPVVENTLPSTLTFEANAEDTFKENYRNQIQIEKPLVINSSAEGVKEILPVEDHIKSEIIEDVPYDAANKLQYKNYTLNEILLEALNRKASDVHLTPGYRVTFRIDGQLKTFNSPILSAKEVFQYAQELASSKKDIELEKSNEIDLTYSIGAKRFRINIFKQMNSFSVVCRVINETIPTPENLGLPYIINSLTKFANGLILVTGPTGSGKSTTLASILNNVNLSDSKHIVTLEDPVEYVLPKGLSVVDQREFGTDFISWPHALRSVLRQDPDIVLIGEMRDIESIEAALQVAETGHLVFATLHTNSAAQSIDRIIDVFPADKQDQIRIQLASVLRAVVSQRLVPLSQGGRTPAVEVVVVNTAVQNAIRENKVYLVDNVIQTSAEEGMISLEKSLVQLVKGGKISAQTAKTFSIKPNEIDLLLSKS